MKSVPVFLLTRTLNFIDCLQEAVPDRPPAEGGDTEASAAMDSDGSIVAPDDGAQLLAAADSDEPAAPGKAEAGNGSGGSSSGSSKVTTDSKARTKAAEQREAGKHQVRALLFEETLPSGLAKLHL